MKASDFKDITEVNESENYIVLLPAIEIEVGDKRPIIRDGKVVEEIAKLKTNAIKMPITAKDITAPPYFGFNERFGSEIVTEMPDWVAEDMKLRLQNHLFNQNVKVKALKGREIDCSTYSNTEEPEPSPETIVRWLEERGESELSALCIKRLIALKKGDIDLAKAIEKSNSREA